MIWFEDIEIGRKTELGSYTFTADEIKRFARQFDLIRSGVAIEEGSGITYSFTKLNEIKPTMIAEATKDARAGAERFAADSGTSRGREPPVTSVAGGSAAGGGASHTIAFALVPP